MVSEDTAAAGAKTKRVNGQQEEGVNRRLLARLARRARRLPVGKQPARCAGLGNRVSIDFD